MQETSQNRSVQHQRGLCRTFFPTVQLRSLKKWTSLLTVTFRTLHELQYRRLPGHPAQHFWRTMLIQHGQSGIWEEAETKAGCLEMISRCHVVCHVLKRLNLQLVGICSHEHHEHHEHTRQRRATGTTREPRGNNLSHPPSTPSPAVQMIAHARPRR